MGDKKVVFVTGGAGYIGSHCVLELLNAGYDVVAIDNFANSVGKGDHAKSLERVEKLTGKKITFHQVDLLDEEALKKAFTERKVDFVIHFAAMKSVGESMEKPFLYYKNNLIGTINLLEVMKESGVKNLVFSSSCTVYGNPEKLPITEEHPIGRNLTNVYGRTKYFTEEMLRDLSHTDPEWNFINLRYFNPVGAHPSGDIGEDPTKPYANIMPYIGQVAVGKKPSLIIFGNDYSTPDGTCVRDYIHIMDLASGHVAAIRKLEKEHVKWRGYNLGIGKGLSVLALKDLFEEVSGKKVNFTIGPRRPHNVDLPVLYCDASLAMKELDWKPQTYNMGTGQGVSVLQLVDAFQRSCGIKIPYEFKPRREGDIVAMYGNVSLAKDELGWNAQCSLEQMCEDFWRWQSKNPNGYLTEEEVAAMNGK